MLAELLDAEFTNREAAIIFCWSRMLVVDEFKHRTKFTNMTFEDFLEALVRMATMKALPGQQELEDAGYADAGLYLLEMKANGDAGLDGYTYEEWLAEDRHKAGWDMEPSEPMAFLVRQLITLLIRAVLEACASPAREATALNTSPEH